MGIEPTALWGPFLRRPAPASRSALHSTHRLSFRRTSQLLIALLLLATLSFRSSLSRPPPADEALAAH